MLGVSLPVRSLIVFPKFCLSSIFFWLEMLFWCWGTGDFSLEASSLLKSECSLCFLEFSTLGDEVESFIQACRSTLISWCILLQQWCVPQGQSQTSSRADEELFAKFLRVDGGLRCWSCGRVLHQLTRDMGICLWAWRRAWLPRPIYLHFLHDIIVSAQFQEPCNSEFHRIFSSI